MFSLIEIPEVLSSQQFALLLFLNNFSVDMPYLIAVTGICYIPKLY